MIQKIENNKHIIMFVLSIISAALVIPNLLGYIFQNNFTDNIIFELVAIGLMLATVAVFLLISLKKANADNKVLALIAAFLYGSSLTSNIYNVINNNWNSIYYLALYAAVIIVFAVTLFCNSKYVKYALYILMLVILCYNLINVFGGNYFSGARLIIGLMLLYLKVNLDKDMGENK